MHSILNPNHETDWMTYRQFVVWCNERAADGCWSLPTAVICMDIMRQMQRCFIFKRKKLWSQINSNNDVYLAIVKPTNEKREEFFSQEEL